jgi:hypothetical protein
MSGRGRPRASITSGQVAAELKAGLKVKQIAKKYNCSPDTVERRANPTRRKGKRVGHHGTSAAKRSPSLVDIGTFKTTAEAEAEDPSKSDAQPTTSVNGRQWLLSKVVGSDIRQRYWYNKDQDRYITVIRGVGEPIVTSGAEHRAICEAYSNMVGKSSTLNEIARDFGMPRAWLIQYLHIHGITHDKEPFSAEELIERTTDDLVEDLYNMKRRAVFTAMNEKSWKEIKKRAALWDNFEHSVSRVVDDWANRFVPDYRPQLVNIMCASRPFSAVFLPMDFHYGKGSWFDEAGHSYTRQSCKELLKFHTENILNSLVARGRPTRIVVPFGSDWFHVDNQFGSTTRGTPQDLDGTPEMILSEGLEFKVEFCDWLRQVAPIVLLPCPGNHDHHSDVALMKYLQAWYRNDHDVEIIDSLMSRNYYVCDNTLIGATHGNDVNLSDLPTLMANERRQEWAQTDHQIFVTGHIHGEVLEDDGGIMHYTCPSLSAADRWHEGRGYNLNRQAMAAIVLDEEDGPTNFVVSARQNRTTVGFNIKNRSRAA